MFWVTICNMTLLEWHTSEFGSLDPFESISLSKLRSIDWCHHCPCNAQETEMQTVCMSRGDSSKDLVDLRSLEEGSPCYRQNSERLAETERSNDKWKPIWKLHINSDLLRGRYCAQGKDVGSTKVSSHGPRPRSQHHQCASFRAKLIQCYFED